MSTKTKPAIGSTFRTGETSPVSGTFKCAMCDKAGQDHKVAVQEGKTFPMCESTAVTWRLDSYTA